MNLEYINDLVQKQLIEAYKLQYPEDCAGLLDEQIKLMCPVSNGDIAIYISDLLTSILKEKKELELEEESLMQDLNETTGLAHHEAEKDLSYCRRKLKESNETIISLRNAFDEIKEGIDLNNGIHRS